MALLAASPPAAAAQRAVSSSRVKLQGNTSGRAAPRCQARGGSGSKRQRRGGGGGGSSSVEDVEIFSIDGGWNVEALEGLEGLLDADAVEAAPPKQRSGKAGSSSGKAGSGKAGSKASSSGGKAGSKASGSKDSGEGSVLDADDGWSVGAVDDGWSVDADDGWSVGAVGGSDGEDLDDEDWGEDEGMEDEAEAFVSDWQEEAGASDDADAPAAAAAGPEAPRFGGRALGKAEQQLLASLPSHMLQQLEEQQREADEEREKLRPAAQKKAALRLKTHQQLRIIAGSAAGRRLRSPQGDQTRPMMEMVRNAVFNMVMSLYGCSSALPETTRWLDLFAGTGAVGIEALSRGCGECHFVEMSPWVVSNCLMPNLEACELESEAVVHTGKAEDFLRRASQLSRFAGGPFDFLSVCPPYELVDYGELYDLLDASPLLHAESIVIVEYPKKLAHLVRDRLGPLTKMRDRRYGRTYIAIYAGEAAEE